MKAIRWIPSPILILFAFVGCDSQSGDSGYEGSTLEESYVRLADADHGGAGLYATMIGAEEAPGPGDPDGSGTAVFTLNPGQQTVCFELAVENIEQATAAHIHIAPPGQPGIVVVPLTPPSDGTSSGCVENVDRNLIKEILRNPGAYYVNVHNQSFPAGAIRGQLER